MVCLWKMVYVVAIYIERSRLPHSIGLIIRTDRWQTDKGSIDYLSIPLEDQGRINTQDFLNLWLIIDHLSIYHRSFINHIQTMSIEPIERRINWMQLNAIEWLAIETQSNITAIFSSIDSAIVQSIEPIKRRQSIERDRRQNSNRTQSDIITQKLAVRSRSIVFNWFDCDFRLIAFDWHCLVISIFYRSYRSFIDHIDLLSILSKDWARIWINLNLWSILNRYLIDSRSIGNRSKYKPIRDQQ